MTVWRAGWWLATVLLVGCARTPEGVAAPADEPALPGADPLVTEQAQLGDGTHVHVPAGLFEVTLPGTGHVRAEQGTDVDTGLDFMVVVRETATAAYVVTLDMGKEPAHPMSLILETPDQVAGDLAREVGGTLVATSEVEAGGLPGLGMDYELTDGMASVRVFRLGSLEYRIWVVAMDPDGAQAEAFLSSFRILPGVARTLKKDLGRETALHILGRAAAVDGRFEEANRLYEQAMVSTTMSAEDRHFIQQDRMAMAIARRDWDTEKTIRAEVARKDAWELTPPDIGISDAYRDAFERSWGRRNSSGYHQGYRQARTRKPKSGEEAEAIAYKMMVSTAYKPGHHYRRVIFAEVLRRAGHTERANAQLMRAASVAPYRFWRAVSDAVPRRDDRTAWAEARRKELDAAPRRDDPDWLRLQTLLVRRLGDRDGARALATRLTEVAPRDPFGWYHLARLDRAAEDLGAARERYERALALDPTNDYIRNNFAWALATDRRAGLRDGARAVELAEPLAARRHPDPTHLDTLAAAYAEAGRWAEAQAAQQRAIDLADTGSTGEDARKDYAARLEQYGARKPFRE